MRGEHDRAQSELWWRARSLGVHGRVLGELVLTLVRANVVLRACWSETLSLSSASSPIYLAACVHLQSTGSSPAVPTSNETADAFAPSLLCTSYFDHQSAAQSEDAHCTVGQNVTAHWYDSGFWMSFIYECISDSLCDQRAIELDLLYAGDRIAWTLLGQCWVSGNPLD